ncbi:MFS transporter [Pectinatus cerevisiiphilus]|uniref:Putative MFS family arabinose efflux permease n=1 Tax=Pectinatus cerevisiiphilus TaxID=86956 RepID=A0A4R3KGN7_9FIRM|nr:MFS transporter [Pectinatus cerevisiiphilus]TCS81831.1 putative MFS family arabinose efflux permease [Pectinatus cerevisiiphilus]
MQQRLWSQAFLGMSFSSLFQYMTHYSLITVLPILVINQFSGSVFQAGLAMTFFQIGAIASRPLAGRLIDSCNKRKILLLFLGAFFVINVLYFFITNINFLLGLRVFHGIAFAVGTTSTATVAALVLPNSRKGEGIGYFAAFSNLAMVIGPFMGLFCLSNFGPTPFFIFIIILGFLIFFAGTYQKLDKNIILPHEKEKKALSLADFLEPKVFSIAFIGGLVFFAYSGILVFIPLYLKSLNLVNYSSLFFAAFALVIILTRPIIGKLFDKFSAKYIIYPGLFLFFCGFIYLSTAQTPPALLVSAVIIGLGFGALGPSFQTMAVQSVPLERAGVATATYFLALDISVGLGSFFLGLVINYMDYSGMYQFAAAVIAVTAIIFFIVFKNK